MYKWIRHPLYFGFILSFWAAPVMTVSHLVFSASFTTFILLALFVEERELVGIHGNAYREYQRRVPKLLPFGRSTEGAGKPRALSQAT